MVNEFLGVIFGATILITNGFNTHNIPLGTVGKLVR
jgi:hypothetical protein